MFFEDYIIEPLKYGLSDFSKILKGGLIYCTSILAFVISIVLFVYHYTTLESLLPYTNSYSQVFLLIGILLLIGGTLLLFILNGYILKMISYNFV